MENQPTFKEKVLKLRDEGKSLNEITQILKDTLPDLTEHQVWERVHGITRTRTTEKVKKKPVGIFSDTHIPFNHPNYLQFCKDTFKKFGVGDIVCCGDLVDNHALSRFQSEPCAKGAYDELDMSVSEVQKYVKAFPKVRMTKGNHDMIPYRQAATIGIGDRYLKNFHELFGLPKTWEISEEFIIDNVMYRHGINCSGKDGAYNAAIQERMSLVIGHSHAFGGIKYSANKRSIIFGMQVGCGIDVDSYAFTYGKYDKNRPTLGCGIVFNDASAIFVPMGAQYFRG